jgi:hypothetical protein
VDRPVYEGSIHRARRAGRPTLRRRWIVRLTAGGSTALGERPSRSGDGLEELLVVAEGDAEGLLEAAVDLADAGLGDSSTFQELTPACQAISLSGTICEIAPALLI